MTDGTRCGAESMRPIVGAYFRGSGEVLAGADPVTYTGYNGHFCQRQSGHEGNHQAQYVERIGYDVGLAYIYQWHDEHELVCIPCVVKLEPDPMSFALSNNSGSGDTVVINLPATPKT